MVVVVVVNVVVVLIVVVVIMAVVVVVCYSAFMKTISIDTRVYILLSVYFKTATVHAPLLPASVGSPPWNSSASPAGIRCIHCLDPRMCNRAGLYLQPAIWTGSAELN